MTREDSYRGRYRFDGHRSHVGAVGRLVGRVNAYAREALGVHPYHVMFDIGLLVIAGVTWVFAQYVHPVAVVKFVAALTATTVTFEIGYLKAKRRLFGIDSRSFLQDLLAYVLPVWIGLAVLFGVDLRVTLDLIGLQLPLLLGFIRVGCFLGGCCYGIPTQYGVRYPSTVFEPHSGGCQSFSPGDDPECRVLPIQLVEAVFNFALFGGIFVHTVVGGVDGSALALYLLGYAGYRFVSDFVRLSSARPNWGPLSEAQWVSLGILLVLGTGAVLPRVAGLA